MKKNQVIIYAIALMLVAAGYLNYTSNIKNIPVSSSEFNEINNEVNEEHSDIGDAKLVSSEIDKNNISNVQTNGNNTISNETDSIGNKNTSNNTVNTNSTSNYSISDNLGNFQDNQVQDTSSQAITNVDDYFSKSKLERDTMYSQTIETYQNILNNDNVPDSQKNIATEQITKINEVKNSIMICENLIQTKGFKDCVIFVNGDSVSIVIQSDKLEVEDIAQIQNIVAREMKASIENIHISNK